MEKKFTGRVLLILGVLLVFLFAGIFPLPRLLSSSIPWGRKHNLKPGLDISGGTALLYEIQAPAGSAGNPDLSRQVADALKRRVDPEGVRNLVWRPQGPNRLEIQMPHSGDDAETTRRIRAEFTAAQERLANTNLRPAQVYAALDIQDAAARQKRLEELAQGSAARKQVIEKLAAVRQEIKAAEQQLAAPQKLLDSVKEEARKAEEELASLPGNATEEQRKAAKEKLDGLRAQVLDAENRMVPLINAVGQKTDELRGLEAELEKTNLPVSLIQLKILDTHQKQIDKYAAKNAAKAKEEREKRQVQIDGLKAQHKDFPARLAAIDDFVAKYDAFQTVKNSVDDAEGLKRLLRGSGVLEFHIAVTTDGSLAPGDRQVVEAMVKRLHDEGPVSKAGDTMKWFVVENQEVAEEYPKRNVTEQVGDTTYILLYTTPDKQMVPNDQNPWGLQGAREEFDNRTNRSVVQFTFDRRGGTLFGELSGANIGRPLAIVLDGRVISAPNLQSRIEDTGIITGTFTPSQINYLVRTLTAGSLPAKLADDPISERSISPTLGKDNLRRGFIASVVGLFVVAIFLIGYYYFAGVVATVAVLMNLIIILGAMAMFNATFTLPGIAALVLTVGMAVDANVLIFERLREEQHRGLSLRLALRNAYDRAFSAILDANVTTAITSLMLYWFGSEEVKGFGLTLLIGIMSSLFTALFVTRTIFEIAIERFDVRKLGSLPLTFPKWDDALRPNIDWMGKAWIFYAFSAVFIVAGLSAFVVKGRQMFDVEFVQGTSVQLTLKNDMAIEAVRARLEPFNKEGQIPSPQVVSIGNSQKDYEVVTPNHNVNDVRTYVLQALQDQLTVQVPSRFEHSDKAFEQLPAENAAVVPVTPGAADSAALRDVGFARSALSAHEGGVAVVLRNLEPALTPEQIKDRVEAARLRSGLTVANVDVEGEAGPKAPTKLAVVLVSDPNSAYAADSPQKQERWKTDLARPVWGLVQEAVSAPPALDRVANVDPQVAQATMTDAVLAITLSLILIMIYIWIRFGNLKYGSATVVALLHDTLLTIGAIGISHYLANTFFGNALQIEAFRINLTMVAAILTVMGYSMNDTVVIFDRIRENRGKYGYVSRQVINDSINQTLSRTLLTGGTTIITILVMYIWGGAGIHGFTFALLVGILVGTYSSIAIASPILLMGGKDVQAGERKPLAMAAAQPASPAPRDRGGKVPRPAGG